MEKLLKKRELVVEKLLEKKELDVNIQDLRGQTALILATTHCYNNDGTTTRLIGKLLERRDIDVNCQDKNGWTALMLATFHGKYSVVKMLLSRDDIDRTSYDEDEERLGEPLASLDLSS